MLVQSIGQIIKEMSYTLIHWKKYASSEGQINMEILSAMRYPFGVNRIRIIYTCKLNKGFGLKCLEGYNKLWQIHEEGLMNDSWNVMIIKTKIRTLV